MSKKRRNYIPRDGYNLDGFIEAREGMNEAVNFVYRPIGAELQAVLNAALALLTDTINNPANLRKRAEIITGRLVSWDMTNEKGEALAINSEEVRSLAPEVFWKMFGIIFGTLPTDINPAWSEKQREEEMMLLGIAIASGRPIGEVREDENAKN